MTDVLERLTELERKVDNLVLVCQGTADDTLRMCFALDVVSKALGLPGTPWEVATRMVDFHHAQRALNEGRVASEDLEKLKLEIIQLRDSYMESLKR